MRTRRPGLSALLLACLLPACGSMDPSATTSNGEPYGTTTDTTVTGTGSTTGTTGTDAPTTGQNTDPTTGTSTGGASSEPTGGTSTGEPDTGTTGATSTGEDTGTGAVSASTSTGETSTDSSTGDPGGLGQAAQDAAAELGLAIDGVLYLSESEDTWTLFAIPDAAPVTEANIKDVIAEIYVPHDDVPLADRVVEPRTLAQLMDPLTVMQDWWGDYEIMQAEQYQQIRVVFENTLSNAKVFRLGKLSGNVLSGQIDVFVIGETVDGDIVGMFAVAVET